MSLRPQFLQQVLVVQGVHRLPETVVHIGGQLMIGRKTLKRRPFPDSRIVLDVVEDAGFEHEEAAVDIATVARGLLAETRHRIVVSEVQGTKTSLWPDSGQ